MNQSGYFQNTREEMLAFVPKEAARILEAGCGEGRFGNSLIRRQQAEVWGIEPDAKAAAVAATQLTKVEHGYFDEKVSAPRNYFDCVIFNDVLEHIVDPWHTLELAKSFLRDGNSVVVASIPNFRYWDNLVDVVYRKEFRYADVGILDRTHLRFFTEKSIAGFFSDSGYEIVRIAGINPTASRKFRLANLISLKAIKDMEFLQFGIVARPVRLPERQG